VLLRSLKIGTIYGVDVKLHPTFALILIWVLYQWGYAAHAGLRGVLFGTAVLLTVFVCVVIHELAHAVVAMRHGLAVRDITLLPIGGVARIEHVALSSRSEILIAVAGPLSNIVIALILTPLVLFVAVANDIHEALGILVYADQLSVAGFVLYLWIANIMLAVFNLLPAFPMDGGRILRAWLASSRGRLKATQVAVGVGQMFALGFAVLGLLAGDYVLLLLSLFILISAQIEARHVQIEARLRFLPVGQFALWDAGGISPSAPLAFATRGGPRDLVVTQNGRVVGMLWRRDMLKHLSEPHREIYVKDVMDREFHPVDPRDSVLDVHFWLADSSGSAVPVVENGQYRGIFTGDRLSHIYDALDEREWRWQRQLLATFVERLKLVWR
jgi:Zn-dependent protease